MPIIADEDWCVYKPDFILLSRIIIPNCHNKIIVNNLDFGCEPFTLLILQAYDWSESVVWNIQI